MSAHACRRSIALVLSLLPAVAPAVPAHKRPAPRWHGYGFLPLLDADADRAGLELRLTIRVRSPSLSSSRALRGPVGSAPRNDGKISPNP
jgi:hypothetical protein